jgi:hypothetical protein
MIGLHREIGGMHGPSRIVSCIPRLTIVPESTVFGAIPENLIISKAGHFGGMADGISPSIIFFMTLFQDFMWTIDNRVGMIQAHPNAAEFTL